MEELLDFFKRKVTFNVVDWGQNSLGLHLHCWHLITAIYQKGLSKPLMLFVYKDISTIKVYKSMGDSISI